jgi:hypothetical protein
MRFHLCVSVADLLLHQITEIDAQVVQDLISFGDG